MRCRSCDLVPREWEAEQAKKKCAADKNSLGKDAAAEKRSMVPEKKIDATERKIEDAKGMESMSGMITDAMDHDIAEARITESNLVTIADSATSENESSIENDDSKGYILVEDEAPDYLATQATPAVVEENLATQTERYAMKNECQEKKENDNSDAVDPFTAMRKILATKKTGGESVYSLSSKLLQAPQQ
ncbi:hypothetical protein B0T16DRAFT_392380 [Cercophora newfieldiana]|uniref:Uncharacterized protein n=1 Tax=Cercophora newfieldiana TaxID=92897 RepID=A0AA39Y2I1_9PEZI|nr:hypothetical protein B0T16DRAFT_392380 [Cercophora newfieldiana]